MTSYDPIKRTLDIVSGSLILIGTLPIQIGVGIAVAIKLGRPVLFRQARPGRNGRIFVLIKFRSMIDLDHDRGLVTDADRLTRFGRALRSTSLDELPTLINVIKGDMSIVGPRPLLVSYLERYSAEQGRRHEVRPGVTGLAQVSGRNAIGWTQKLALDVDYVDTRSFRTDLGILAKTVTAVLHRDGISATGHVTAREFLGSNAQDGQS